MAAEAMGTFTVTWAARRSAADDLLTYTVERMQLVEVTSQIDVTR
jgi:hypothetical protein